MLSHESSFCLELFERPSYLDRYVDVDNSSPILFKNILIFFSFRSNFILLSSILSFSFWIAFCLLVLLRFFLRSFSFFSIPSFLLHYFPSFFHSFFFLINPFHVSFSRMSVSNSIYSYFSRKVPRRNQMISKLVLPIYYKWVRSSLGLYTYGR